MHRNRTLERGILVPIWGSITPRGSIDRVRLAVWGGVTTPEKVFFCVRVFFLASIFHVEFQWTPRRLFLFDWSRERVSRSKVEPFVRFERPSVAAILDRHLGRPQQQQQQQQQQERKEKTPCLIGGAASVWLLHSDWLFGCLFFFVIDRKEETPHLDWRTKQKNASKKERKKKKRV